MPNRQNRIPVPWAQRWEIARERLAPVLCFVATVAACAWLWRHQSSVAPFAVGEVHVDWVEIRSPCDGELLSVERYADGRWPLFAEVHEGTSIARVRKSSDEIVDVRAPMDGVVTAVPALPGQPVQKGEPVLKMASPRAQYILCHLADLRGEAPKPGRRVAIRRHGRASGWTETVVEAVGPAVEAGPADQELGLAPVRGLPIRIALPKDVPFTPGSQVDVRFARQGAM
jgi:hypothetical protein